MPGYVAAELRPHPTPMQRSMRRPRSPARRLVGALALVAMAVLPSACEPIAPQGSESDSGVTLLRARTLTDRLASLAPEELTDAQVIALGYQERARLGLGSPFRLMELALNDPHLTREERHTVAYALLARAHEGQTYEVDPRVLDLVRLAGVDQHVGTGERQLELIERVIAIAPTPAAGERLVRVAYALAGAERTASSRFPSIVAHVAALVADRRRAREDADRLLAAARTARISPLDLVVTWRAERRFVTEWPAMTELSAAEEEAVAANAPRTAVALRAISQRLAYSTGFSGPAAAPSPPASPTLLSRGTAERLLAIAEGRDQPPQAPISVALLINRIGYLDGAGANEDRRTHRLAFLDGAYSEERFAAGLVLQDSLAAVEAARRRLIELQAAVFFRVWNQEQPWFPGDAAPAARDLLARFGLADVQFGRAVPESWRPYYRRTLGIALADLERVLPTASVRGLTIRFDALPVDRRALALHDPTSRTLYLPPETGAGTLAHEIAHDLDWQLARRRYGARGYATDLAVSSGRGDRIAYALTELANSLTQPDSLPTPHDTRPAEVFARGTDWFVAALLAREGRTGGYLTSFQDPALTGYGTTRGPDIGGGAVGSLLDILQAIAPVESAAARWATEVYGPQRRLTPAEITRAIVAAGGDLPPMERFAAIRDTRQVSLGAVDETLCRLASVEALRRLSAAQRTLIDAAAAATARGAAFDAAREVADAQGLDPDLTGSWMASRLYGAPAPADSALEEAAPMLEEVLYLARERDRNGPAELVDPFGFAPQAALCGGNPFASLPLRARPRASSGAERP